MRQARAKVVKRGKSWHYRVFLGNGKLFVYDDCTDRELIFRMAMRDVAVARRFESIGHDTKADYMLLVMEEDI